MTENRSFLHWLWDRQSLPKALRKWIYKRLSKRQAAPDFPFECDFYGLNYSGNLQNGIESAIYFYGAFEKPLLYFLRDSMQGLAPAGGVFCDIGANIGQHSLFMSRYAAQVHAFEPLDSVSARLKQHIASNQLTNITVHDLGLSDSNGRLPFFAPTGSNQGVGSFDAQSQARGNTPVGELAIARGDDYLTAQGISRIDVMKIDVEGFEQKVLAGMQQSLRQLRPLIALEVTYGDSHSFASIEALLAALPEDYALYIFDTRKPDGSTARRRGARAKRTGEYRLLPLTHWRDRDQDDLVAVPVEKLASISLGNS